MSDIKYPADANRARGERTRLWARDQIAKLRPFLNRRSIDDAAIFCQSDGQNIMPTNIAFSQRTSDISGNTDITSSNFNTSQLPFVDNGEIAGTTGRQCTKNIVASNHQVGSNPQFSNSANSRSREPQTGIINFIAQTTEIPVTFAATKDFSDIPSNKSDIATGANPHNRCHNPIIALLQVTDEQSTSKSGPARTISGRDAVTPPLLDDAERGAGESTNARLHRLIGRYRDST